MTKRTSFSSFFLGPGPVLKCDPRCFHLMPRSLQLFCSPIEFHHFFGGRVYHIWDRLNRDVFFVITIITTMFFLCGLYAFYNFAFHTVYFILFFLHLLFSSTPLFITINKFGKLQRFYGKKNNDGQVDCARHIPPELENTLLMLRWWGFRERVGSLRVRWVWQAL